ncbi:hypothetical protein SCFA_1390009 [anaerobic digester metagenome]|jgi:hypothetical protein|uniref:Uncharacterized protein n=1 Tax=anaerobic digester metagenome TaxID=1263854 RepID=A0A485LXL4_9ZZZZ
MNFFLQSSRRVQISHNDLPTVMLLNNNRQGTKVNVVWRRKSDYIPTACAGPAAEQGCRLFM